MIINLSKEQHDAMCVLTHPEYSHVHRVLYGGQAGGGKSTLICLWLITMAEHYPETRYYLARERLKEIKESVLLTFWDVVKMVQADVKYNENKSLITFSNGSQIYLVEVFAYPSDPNFDSLGSREYTAGAIEEGISVTKRASDLLLSRTRYKHDIYDLHPKQLITCNPSDGWIKDEIVIPTLEGLPMRSSDMFIRATLDSNPNEKFKELYKKNLEQNLTSYDRARLLHGDWNAKPMTGAEYLKEFDADVHVTSEVKYDPMRPLHVSFDENVHPYITCLIFQISEVDGTKIISQIDEICQKPPNNSRRQVCREVVRRYNNHIAGMFIYGDASSRKTDTGKEYGDNFFTDIISELKRFHPALRVPPKNPPVVSKAGFLNLILEKQYRNIAIRISYDCKLSVSDYVNAIEDVDGGILKSRTKDPETGIFYERYGHHCDALSYFVCEAFIGDFEYYLAGDWSPEYTVGDDREYRFNR